MDENQRRAERRAAQDRFLSVQQRQFDGHVAENTDKRGGWRGMKYERAQFTVVTASPAYRDGWDRIFGTPRSESVDLDSNRPMDGKEVHLEPDYLLRRC